MKATKAPLCRRGSFLTVTTAFLLLCPLFHQARAQLGSQTVERFIYAIYQNDTNTAWRMLESNTNLAYCAQRVDADILPLLEAAAAGNVALAKRLVELGADINAEGRIFSGGSKMTALDEAVEHGRLEICRLLLEAGANPNHRSFQDTTLHLAFKSFHSGTNQNAIATALLEYGADPFAEAGYYKTTPFELAISRSDGRLVPLMLDTDRKIKSAPKKSSDASPKSKTTSAKDRVSQILAARGTVMLSTAAQRGELEAVEALLKAGVSARTNLQTELPVLQSFSLSAAEAAKSRDAAVSQLEQTRQRLKEFGTNANPGFLSSLRSQEAGQAAKVAALAPERWQQIRDLLIKNGADYDAFAATALGDRPQAEQLLSADKTVVLARNRDGETPLHWAVKTDQLPFASFWIQSGVPLATTNFAGQTALHIAAANGKIEFVKILLAAKAPTGIRNTNGWTPLDAAIQAKQSDAIRLLLAEKSAPPHPERGFAITLHDAAATGNIAALVALLETESNLEARNELGLTPLQVAVTQGHLAAAALLVDKGADINVRDPDGNTLLHHIFLQDRFMVRDRPPTNWLAGLKDSPHKDEFIKYLTVGQYEQGPNEILQGTSFLLACGLNAQATNHAGQTVMQLVTDEKTSRSVFFFDDDREKLFKLLSGAGVNLEHRDVDGNTALHRLCTGGYDISKVEQMVALIASGADVNATNNLGQTPLHIAAQNIGGWDGNDPPVNEPFQLLVYKKANVNARDNQGRTPLDVLAASDTSFKQEATALLIKAGAKTGGTDKAEHGRTPAHMALTGAWPWRSAGETLQQLAAAGADLSAKDDQGRTPLHYLAMLGNQSPMFFIRGVGDTFVKAKVDINARDNDGNTPLHLAAKYGTRDVFDWLVKQGADLDATNNAGETPRQLAARSTDPFRGFARNADIDIFQAIREGKLESVAAILKSAPDLLNKTNQFRQTPLMAAAQTRRRNIVEFLDQQGARWDAQSAVLAGRTDKLQNLLAQQPKLVADGSLLRLAAAEGNSPAVETLLANGADLKATDPAGLSSLGNALVNKHDDIASQLARQGAVKNIFDAVFSGDPETAATLIARDKSLATATNALGFSVAEIAAAIGDEKTLKQLLAKGVSPNFQSPFSGKSLLYSAAAYDQTNTATLLLQHGAKADVADDLGLTPLHVAAFRGSADVLNLLLNHKADWNARVAASRDMPPFDGMPNSPVGRRQMLEGNTALHMAAMNAQTNCITVLIKWGAAVNATNSSGFTPLGLVAGFNLPQFFLMSRTGLGPPFAPSIFDKRDNPMSRRQAAITLLEQAGGKHGERRGPNGMMSGMMPMYSPPTPPARQLSAMADGREYHDQGCADYNAHNFTSALADFRKSCELGSDAQDYSYYRIWIIRSRLGETEAATKELQAYLEHRKVQQPPDWTLQVGRFLTGQLSESDLLKAADNANDQTSREQHCEAYFYAGMKRLIENDKATAVDYLNKCLATKVETFEEYTSAKADLRFLETPLPNSK